MSGADWSCHLGNTLRGTKRGDIMGGRVGGSKVSEWVQTADCLGPSLGRVKDTLSSERSTTHNGLHILCLSTSKIFHPSFLSHMMIASCQNMSCLQICWLFWSVPPSAQPCFKEYINEYLSLLLFLLHYFHSVIFELRISNFSPDCSS